MYPVKSLDGFTVDHAEVLASGALRGDRADALVDAAGQFVNGKRDARIHRVRSRFSPDLHHITLWADLTTGITAAQTFHRSRDRAALEAWLSDYFQQPITLQHNGVMGFPDDTASPGPTVISTATLETVATWFDLSLDETRRRFRTNLEIGGVPPFWEDRLFSDTGSPVEFSIGAVTLLGINPCQRCVVPTRNTLTGAVTAAFVKRFNQERQATMPPFVARSRFNHFYRLAVNTRLAPTEAGKVIRVGDRILLPT